MYHKFNIFLIINFVFAILCFTTYWNIFLSSKYGYITNNLYSKKLIRFINGSYLKCNDETNKPENIIQKSSNIKNVTSSDIKNRTMLPNELYNFHDHILILPIAIQNISEQYVTAFTKKDENTNRQKQNISNLSEEFNPKILKHIYNLENIKFIKFKDVPINDSIKNYVFFKKYKPITSFFGKENFKNISLETKKNLNVSKLRLIPYKIILNLNSKYSRSRPVLVKFHNSRSQLLQYLSMKFIMFILYLIRFVFYCTFSRCIIRCIGIALY